MDIIRPVAIALRLAKFGAIRILKGLSSSPPYAFFAAAYRGWVMRVWSRRDGARSLAASPTARGLVLAAVGLAVWTGLSLWGGAAGGEDGLGLREAWDTPAYFYAGVPVMAVAVAAAAFFMPERVWRWPLWLVGGHQAGVMLVGLGMQSGLSLVILTLMLAVLLAALFAVPALVGSLLAKHMSAHQS
jgi:hypothetical protein